jgi:hypothetical protein
MIGYNTFGTKHMNHVSTFGLCTTVNCNMHYMHIHCLCHVSTLPTYMTLCTALLLKVTMPPTQKGGDSINPSTLIVPHNNIIRSCSRISCIKSNVTCSTASAVLEMYQASLEETVKGQPISPS